MFELLHPQNRYAVKYEKRIVLHGVRNMQSLEETDPVLIAVCRSALSLSIPSPFLHLSYFSLLLSY